MTFLELGLLFAISYFQNQLTFYHMKIRLIFIILCFYAKSPGNVFMEAWLFNFFPVSLLFLKFSNITCKKTVWGRFSSHWISIERSTIIWYQVRTWIGVFPIKSFVPNAPFLCFLKTSENLTVFCFQGAKKGCIGNRWVKHILIADTRLESWLLLTRYTTKLPL